MIIRIHTHAKLALGLVAAGAMAFGACAPADTIPGTTGGNTDENSVAYAGFALTADDNSDDSFTDGADATPIIDELGDVMAESDEPPTADEADPAPPEPPDRIARTVLVVWGQPTLNPDFGEPSTWEGQISSDVATVRVLRKIQFEPGDHLVRDGDPKAVTFRTVTGPHHDGVLLRVVAPRSAETLAGVLSFRTTKFHRTIPLADLLDGYHDVFSADASGNALIVSTVREHRCGQGLMRLNWKRLDARGGVFGGKVYGPEGEISAYVAGVWGRVGGKNRFKGLFLDAERRHRGVLKGAFAAFPAAAGHNGGVFRGVWMLRNRDIGGVLGGIYRVGPGGGQGTAVGHLIARCDDETPACDADIDLPAPPAADCSCGADEENGTDEACACVAVPAPTCIPVEPPASESPASAE